MVLVGWAKKAQSTVAASKIPSTKMTQLLAASRGSCYGC